LHKIFKVIGELKAMASSYRDIRQGLHPVYSVQEVEKQALDCREAWNRFIRKGGELKISIEWLKDLMGKGMDIGSIMAEACHHGELECVYERQKNLYIFMVQANIDVVRGVKTIKEIYEEEKKLFWGYGLWGYAGATMLEKGRKYDKWIQKNYDMMKTA
jgi:hypothetical protein